MFSCADQFLDSFLGLQFLLCISIINLPKYTTNLEILLVKIYPQQPKYKSFYKKRVLFKRNSAMCVAWHPLTWRAPAWQRIPCVVSTLCRPPVHTSILFCDITASRRRSSTVLLFTGYSTFPPITWEPLTCQEPALTSNAMYPLYISLPFRFPWAPC